MKRIYRLLLAGTFFFLTAACEDLNTLNNNPNHPGEVPSNMLMNGAQKMVMDEIYDSEFSGRQCLQYAQHWMQRSYTEGSRYQVREVDNNSKFNRLYMGLANFQKVMELNTNPKTAAGNAAYGANCNQIASAKILKVWLICIITDTWGNVPYTDTAQMESKDVMYCRYDNQQDIYNDMMDELTEAVNMIDESKPTFTSGDVIYGGDASKWKKFGNSLKCRLAVHLSKVNPEWRTYIREAIAGGVFEDNSDAATYAYSVSGSDYSRFYYNYFVYTRNDYTLSKPFADILQGVEDDLNEKTHPWKGITDPRLKMYTTPIDGLYKGVPYGVSNSDAIALRAGSPDWYNYPPAFLRADFAMPLMTFAELKFILSEYNNYSASDYKEGVEASIQYWAEHTGTSVSPTDVAAYIDAVSQKVDAEAVATQKYIDLFLNGTEAWTEIRRTGYPEQILRPGEISARLEDGTDILFETLSEVQGDIISRIPYPVSESTLNKANWEEAVAKLKDGTNNYYSKMYWDARTSTYDHPVNK